MVTSFPLLACHMGFQVLAAVTCLHPNSMTFCKHCYFKVRLTVIILPKMSQILFSMKSLPSYLMVNIGIYTPYSLTLT